MFCNHCGKSISENSVYCSHCGNKQSNEKSLQEEKMFEKTTENKIKNFINDNKGFIVFYLIWFFVYFFLILTGDGCSNIFYILGGRYGFNFIEFIFYIIAPVIIWAIWKLIGKNINDAINPKK